MPPVLDIAFHELSGGRAQDVVAREVGRGVHESHHVLQLVAKAVSATRLIKGRATPHTATESLVKQPAVEQKVRGKLGCFHFDRAQESVPPTARFLECSLDVCRIAKTSHESACCFFIVRLSEEKSHLDGLFRFNLDHDLHGGARIEAGANVASQSFVLHRGRIAQRAVAPDEHGAITGERGRRWSRSGKSDAFAKFRIVGAAGEQTLALQLPFRDAMPTRLAWIRPENEPGVGGEWGLPPSPR